MKSKNRTKPSLHLIEQISLNSIAAYFINKKKKAGKSRENKLWGQIGSLFASWEHELSAALFQNISGNDKVKHHCNCFCCLKAGLYIKTSFCRQSQKHPLWGFSLPFLLPLPAENHVCRGSPAAPLFALLPLCSSTSGSLLSTSAILLSMAIQVIACLLVLGFPFHSLPFFSPCKPFATRTGRW